MGLPDVATSDIGKPTLAAQNPTNANTNVPNANEMTGKKKVRMTASLTIK